MKLKRSIAISDSGFLFNPITGDSFSLNPTATEILRLFQQGASESDVISFIQENYIVDKNTAEKDLQDFRDQLMHYKLIE
ncbi:MAG: PqqD family protein [Chitinophagales bacterium]|nr:PqqD family protein [Chitinophagales bacterium]